MDIQETTQDGKPVRDYFVGLDLGQAADYTAVAVLERAGATNEGSVFTVRHLERFPLRTSYATIVSTIAKQVEAPPLLQQVNRYESSGVHTAIRTRWKPPTLAVDATGCGRPVVDMLKRA